MATEWSFPVVTLPANPHRSLPVFAIPPNWKNGVTETLAWLTDVMSSETAVEQRRSLRRFPRRSFEYSFMRQGTARARIDNFLAGVGKRDCLLPIWHEQYTLGTPDSNGLVQFPADSLAMREFAVDDLVLVTNMDADRWGLLSVATVDLINDQIELVAVDNVGTWPQGSRIVPMRRAKMLDSVSLDNVTDRVGTTRMRFTLQDADERFTPSWGYCSPLWRIRPDRANPITMDFNRSDYTLDFSAGVVDVTDPGDRAQISQSMSIKLFGRLNTWSYRSFLYSARGRARRFYVPTYASDVETIGDIGGVSFDAKPNGLSDYFLGPQESRAILAIQFSDGRPAVYRTITGIASVAGTVAPYRPDAEQISVDLALPPILKRDIERISFVVPSRFDQDTIELFHAAGDCAAVTSSVVTRSSIVDGMPPIECWVTSRPYPVSVSEELSLDATITSGRLYTAGISFVEDVISQATIVAGNLQKVVSFVDYPNYEPEEIQSNALITAGILLDVLVSMSTGPEEITSSSLITSGTLKRIVIEHGMPVDSLNSNSIITGGSLI